MATVSPIEPQRSTNCDKQTGQTVPPLHCGNDGNEKQDQALESPEPNTDTSTGKVARIFTKNVEKFQFAPPSMTQDRPNSGAKTSPVDLQENVDTPQQWKQSEQVKIPRDQAEAEPKAVDTVLPSVEGEGVDVDETLVEPTTEFDVHQQMASSPKSCVQIKPPSAAARAEHQKPVLNGRVAKHPTPRTRVRQPPPQGSPRPASTATSQPTEEDMLFLLMHRYRCAKDRELDLAASHKQLQVHNSRLHEQSRTWQQKLAAANAHTERQELAISAYKAEIENFKSRFTKFKDYAKNLAKDHTELGAALKKIRSSQSDITREKDGIRSDLESLKQATASTNKVLGGLVPKISATAHELRPLEQALRTADEKAKINEANLKHERLRNNRIEAQILNSQQIQEQLSLSSMQEYRTAAVYLDELCHTILQLGKIITKKIQPKDTPGVEQCLNLLKALKEKQSAGITTLAETKTVVNAVSER